MHPETLLAQAGSRRDAATGAISMPIHTSAAFQHPALGQSTGFDYSRTSNPTRLALEQTMAALDGSQSTAFAFASGLAAIDAVLRLFSPGDQLIVSEDLYGGTFRLFEHFGRAQNIDFIYVDTSNTQAVADAFDAAKKSGKSNIRGLFVEMPTNPLLKVADLGALGKIARAHDAAFMVDNTFLTPALCRPFEYGADIVVYSATKYLGGHNDLIAGFAVTKNPAFSERLAFIQNAAGATLSPFDSWLLLRSLKTLPIRLKKHEENALAVAQFLQAHPCIKNLHYPGLPTDPGHDILRAQSAGFGAMISFEVASRAHVERLLAQVKVFMFAESLGGTESLITYPITQTHSNIAPETLAKLGVTDRLVRLSIGLENASDLIDDLAAVL